MLRILMDTAVVPPKIWVGTNPNLNAITLEALNETTSIFKTKAFPCCQQYTINSCRYDLA